MALVRVPKHLRTPALEFSTDNSGWRISGGRFRAIGFRSPKIGEIYWENSPGAVFECFVQQLSKSVILERVK